MKKGKESIDEVAFRPIAGAHSISVTRTKTARGGQGGGPDFDYESEEKVHPTLKHAQAHLAAVFPVENVHEDKGGVKATPEEIRVAEGE